MDVEEIWTADWEEERMEGGRRRMGQRRRQTKSGGDNISNLALGI